VRKRSIQTFLPFVLIAAVIAVTAVALHGAAQSENAPASPGSGPVAPALQPAPNMPMFDTSKPPEISLRDLPPLRRFDGRDSEESQDSVAPAEPLTPEQLELQRKIEELKKRPSPFRRNKEEEAEGEN